MVGRWRKTGEVATLAGVVDEARSSGSRSGTLLSRDRLRYVTLDERGRFVVGGRLKAEFENGRSYYGLQGHVVATPRDRTLAPASEAIAWHREHVYLG